MKSCDQDIITGVLAGDRERFGDLVKRHAGPLWGSLRSSMSNMEDAREVFQETWLRAFERLDTLQDPRRLRSWLISIAFNLVRHGGRRRGLLRLATEDEIEQVPDHEGNEPGLALQRSEQQSLLRAHIEQLPNRQREVLDLRLNHELSHGQIGAELGISAEASRSNYYQALRKLRALSSISNDGHHHE